MIKLLIADDELLTLEDMADLNWASIGIDKVYTAANGAEAYELALKEKPEIILTDIEMPKLNGIELAEKLSADLSEVKFIFLTAHDNFDYAQAAVTNHIFSYILKPFDEEDLLSDVKKAANIIKTDRERVSYHDYLAKQLERSRHFLMGYFFDALEGREDNVNNLLRILNITRPNAYYTAIVVTLTPPGKENAFAGNYQTFVELNKLFAPEKATVLSFFNTAHLVYFTAGDEPFAPTQTQSVILTLADAAKKYLDENQITDYLITIGNSVSGIRNCETAYRSALDAIAYSYYLGFNTIICIADIELTNTAGYFQAVQDDQFFNLIKAGNFEGANFLLQRMFRSFSESQLSVNEVQHICHSILVRLALCLLQCGQNPDFLFNKTNALDVIRQRKTVNDLKTFMIDTIDAVTSNITLNYSQRDRELITSIREYINANPATSLSKIAEHFHHSSSYLSHIFPKETGNTIKNYIIEKRVAYAKDLLKNSTKSIGQISSEVGYKNQQHFSNIFSKATGMTPSDYRRFHIRKINRNIIKAPHESSPKRTC